MHLQGGASAWIERGLPTGPTQEDVLTVSAAD